jgi:hypothetical protein
MNENIKTGSRPFYDDVNFVGGIARSGFFTRKEASDLIDYGYRLQQLVQGVISPETEDEQRFVEEISEQKTTDILYATKLWQKYLASVEKAHRKASVFGHAPVVSSDFDADASNEELSEDVA